MCDCSPPEYCCPEHRHIDQLEAEIERLKALVEEAA